MPTLDAYIPSTTKQIVYPVSDQIIFHILESLGLNKLFTDSLFINTDVSASSDFTDDDDKFRLHPNRCNVDVLPNVNPMNNAFDNITTKDTEVKQTANRYQYQKFPIFGDKKYEIALYEQTLPTSVELDFKMKLKSMELVDIVNTALYSKGLSSGSVFTYNNIVFNYTMPDRVLLYLYRMFKMMGIPNTEMTFQDYVKYGSNTAIGLLHNRDRLDGKNAAIGVTRANSRVLGKFIYDADVPDKEKENKVVDRYEIAFKYIFQFTKPLTLQLDYPVAINNATLPKAMRNPPNELNANDEANRYHHNVGVNAYFATRNRLPDMDKVYGTTHYPDNDKWDNSSLMYDNFTQHHRPRMIALLQVDVDTQVQTESLSINIVTDIFPLLDPQLVESINRAWTISTAHEILHKESIFNIFLFNGENVVDPSRLSFDMDTYTLSMDEVSYKNNYRLMITQVKAIKLLSTKVIYHILDNPEYYKTFLLVNVEFLAECGYITVIKDRLRGTESVTLPRKYRPKPALGQGTRPGRAINIIDYIISVNPIRG